MRIRHATREDNTLLAEIGAETFRDAFGSQNSPSDMALYLATAFSPEIQGQELADPASLFLIAEIDGEPVGYTHLRGGGPARPLPSSRPLEIARFYARKDWIGKGVGSALMRSALREARKGSHDLVWLDVWERNRRAIAFYRKWGFTEVGSQPFRLGDDIQHDLIMARMIDEAGGS